MNNYIQTDAIINDEINKNDEHINSSTLLSNSEIQHNYIKCNNSYEEYRMHYTAYGIQDNSKATILCLHGLNRNSRDWDYLANYLVSLSYYVIAPDIVGRGNSDYLNNNHVAYDIPYYVQDIIQLIETLKLTNIHLVGTSMGGLIAINLLSNNPHYRSICKSLVLNDIGAEVELNGLLRIASYSSIQESYTSYIDIKNFILNISKPYGITNKVVEEHLVIHSICKNANGKYELKRDVNINKVLEQILYKLNNNKTNLTLWQEWQALNNLATLVIRGEHSDILTQETIERMQKINTNTLSITIKNTAHAPYLYRLIDILPIINFIEYNN